MRREEKKKKKEKAELLPLKVYSYLFSHFGDIFVNHHKNKYRKNSKNWDTLNYYRDCPTNGIVGFYCAILHSKDADRITNRVDTDQTAP